MKKLIITHGLIAGLIITAFMIYSTAMCYTHPEFDSNPVLGYVATLLAVSFIFIGVKKARDRYNGGVISFGKAFKTGLYIVLIASTLYVLAWLVEYYLFIPDFMEKYTAHVLHQAEVRGAGAAEAEQQAARMAGMEQMYRNPVFVVLFTYMEVLPLGVIIALLSAWILRRKPQAPGGTAAAV